MATAVRERSNSDPSIKSISFAENDGADRAFNALIVDNQNDVKITREKQPGFFSRIFGRTSKQKDTSLTGKVKQVIKNSSYGKLAIFVGGTWFFGGISTMILASVVEASAATVRNLCSEDSSIQSEHKNGNKKVENELQKNGSIKGKTNPAARKGKGAKRSEEATVSKDTSIQISTKKPSLPFPSCSSIVLSAISNFSLAADSAAGAAPSLLVTIGLPTVCKLAYDKYSNRLVSFLNIKDLSGVKQKAINFAKKTIVDMANMVEKADKQG